MTSWVSIMLPLRPLRLASPCRRSPRTPGRRSGGSRRQRERCRTTKTRRNRNRTPIRVRHLKQQFTMSPTRMRFNHFCFWLIFLLDFLGKNLITVNTCLSLSYIHQEIAIQLCRRLFLCVPRIVLSLVYPHKPGTDLVIPRSLVSPIPAYQKFF